MGHLLRMLVLPFILAASLCSRQHTVYTRLVDSTSASIVRITGEMDVETMFGTQRAEYVCTGWVVAQNRVMTAGHCGSDDMRADGYQAHVLLMDKYYDLALLDTPTGTKPALVIATQAPTTYEHLVAIGYAHGFTRPFVLDEKVVLLDYTPDPAIAPGLWMSPGFMGGMSGGPVVDEHGVVVAIVQRTADQAGYGVSAFLIRAFLVGTGTVS
jgi:Trypsin-like peptidase domain